MNYNDYMLRIAAFASLALLAAPSLKAEEEPCGLSQVKETASATYLPLAKAAHIQGQVILLAEFSSDGSVSHISVISGPEMLKSGAVDFAKGWRANPYSGLRTCPVVITYSLDPPEMPEAKSGFTDKQHYTVFGQAPCLCDPSAVIRRRRRFLLF